MYGYVLFLSCLLFSLKLFEENLKCRLTELRCFWNGSWGLSQSVRYEPFSPCYVSSGVVKRQTLIHHTYKMTCWSSLNSGRCFESKKTRKRALYLACFHIDKIPLLIILNYSRKLVACIAHNSFSCSWTAHWKDALRLVPRSSFIISTFINETKTTKR